MRQSVNYTMKKAGWLFLKIVWLSTSAKKELYITWSI